VEDRLPKPFKLSDLFVAVARWGPEPSAARPATTASAGSKTFTVHATDKVGNAASQTVSYSAGYRFSGFLAPVNNPPAVNTGKGGRTYPVKFQITSANGTYVSNLSVVKSIQYQAAACGAFTTDPSDPLETTATGGSSPAYFNLS
jgi:hypothetical protein